ncbi:unnamed protein product [Candidula unifasciata]|uniref:ODAD1 central coiled coil region domain-containing protein n=1 Tax=Candidula unifasciata TaxID=100452 RepID=A0A8S4A4S2_9EUPU|nr:unnamed protein product [Candidula unifasciata]
MPHPRSAQSDVSDADMEGLQEQELVNLQRSFRMMEGERAMYTEESQNVIRKQKQEIKLLVAEKSELLKELKLAESRSNQIKDEGNKEALVTLLETKDKHEEAMKEQEEMQKELDAKIREWERKIKEHHKNVGGAQTGTKHTTQAQNTQRVLENRLDQAKKKFNSCLSYNAKLRDEIEGHRNEHRKFETLYKKLEKELKNLRKEMAEVIEASTAAYDARDDAQAKMVMLQEKADKDLQQHNTEMKELVRIIDHDRKLKEFMSIKGQDRQEDPQLVAWRQRKEALEMEKKKDSQEDSVETYEEAFIRIRELTGEEDIDVLVNRFIKVEDTNFALFNYVNEQNSEIEKLNEDISAIEKEIENFKSQSIELESHRKQILKSLEERQSKATREAHEYTQKHKEVMKILDQLKSGIESVFNKTNCDRSAIDNMLGASSGITDTNMIQYLGIIEQRTNELLAIQAFCTQKDQEKADLKSVSFLGEGPSPPQPPPPVIPPSVGDEYESEASEEEDEEARPLTREELQKRVLKTVKKREVAAVKDGFKYDLSVSREKLQKKREGKKTEAANW